MAIRRRSGGTIAGKLNRGQIKTAYMHISRIYCVMLKQARSLNNKDLRPMISVMPSGRRETSPRSGRQKRHKRKRLRDSLRQHGKPSARAEQTWLNEGNKQIKEIEDSKQPVEAKVPQIVTAIHQYRAQANIARREIRRQRLGCDAEQSSTRKTRTVGSPVRSGPRTRHGPDVPTTRRPKKADEHNSRAC